tara:strand:+ start:940 stop:4779 length:3840 start_codon:yes stop_codon:yes gene_type:complete
MAKNPFGDSPLQQNPFGDTPVDIILPYLPTRISPFEKKEKLGFAKNLFRTLGGAARDIAQSTIDLAQDIGPSGSGFVFGDDPNTPEIEKGIRFTKDVGDARIKLPTVPEPTYFAGPFARDVATFVPAFTKVGSLASGITATTTKQKIAKGAGIGAVAEQFAFSPYEQRISNLIQSKLPNPVTEYLQADPNDTAATARFKMALEGAALGVPVDAALRTIGKLRAAKKENDVVEQIQETQKTQEPLVVQDTPQEIIAEGTPLGAAIEQPTPKNKMLPPSLRNPDPRQRPEVLTVRSLLKGRVPRNDPDFEEIASALGYDKSNFPLAYTAPNAPVSPATGRVKSSVADELLGELDELDFFQGTGKGLKETEGKPTELMPSDLFEALEKNTALPQFEPEMIRYYEKQREIDNILDTLDAENIDPVGLSEEQLNKVLNKIFERDNAIANVVDQQEKLAISKQQTDEIYQEMMAMEKSRSITLDDLDVIPPRNTIDDVPESFTAKDVGFSTRPERSIENIGEEKFAGNINLTKINEPDEIKDIINKIATDNDSFLDARRNVVKFGSKGENLEALARDLGLSDATLFKRKVGQAFNSEQAYAARILFDEAISEAYDLAKIAKDVNASQVDLINFQVAMARAAAIQEQIAGITAEAGRALRSFRESVGPASGKSPKERDKLIKEFVALKGGDDVIKDIANKMSLLDDPAALAKFTRDQYKPTFLDYIQEFWINALLSSPSTHIVNTLSNTLVAGLTPIEYITAAAIGKVRGGENIVTFGEAGARVLGTLYGTIDGLRAAGRAIVTGEAVDPLTKLELNRQETIPGILGRVVRLPGTALVAEDAFFKSIGYRQELWGRAFRQSQKEKKGLVRAYEIMRNPEELAPDVQIDAIDAGRYQTFTNPLGTGGQAFQKIVQRYPALRFITPFIRTPVNIVNYAFERTPAGLLGERYKRAIQQGGEVADLQRAKLAVGAAIGSSVLYYANSGLITGRGPTDSREKSILMETGWQPYSLRIGDKYYSYNRFEPVGILFGITADMSDIGKYVDRQLTAEENVELGKLMSMLAASFSENITNKTFLTGLSDTIEMINDPDRYGEATIQRFVSSFVPTFTYYERKADDPVIRDVQTFGDSFVNRFPEIVGTTGARTSVDLPPKRNVFGEIRTFTPTFDPLGGRYSPVRVSTVTDDVVFNEFVNLGYTPPFPKRTIGNVKLTPQQYETLLANQQILGTKQIIARLVTSPGYNRLTTSAKQDAIAKIFRTNQEKARQMLQGQYPEIVQKEIQETIEAIQN